MLSLNITQTLGSLDPEWCLFHPPPLPRGDSKNVLAAQVGGNEATEIIMTLEMENYDLSKQFSCETQPTLARSFPYVISSPREPASQYQSKGSFPCA